MPKTAALPQTPKRGRGRPRIERDEQVARRIKAMVGMGASLMMIADLEDRDRHVLARLYEREIATGATEANLAIAQALFAAAKRGDVKAMQFWLRCRAGWCESQPTRVVEYHGQSARSAALGLTAEKDTGWDALLNPPGSGAVQ
ncbi:hypothetical protein [Variovorax rhizosphaerae]|uniref:Uncharacterized protein n=1 Tax=Variovorax rhizosphaerae TaxID=1836200 RepID=A0ABU8WL68_9BURK